MESISTKPCTKCGEWRPFTDFNKDKSTPDGMGYWCKQCKAEHAKEYRVKHPRKEYYKKFCLKYKYNLTCDEWDKLYKKQEGCCAICGVHQSELGEALCVDHDHETSKIRGLLCKKCNLGIGNLKHDAENCLKAYQYLRQRS